MYGVIGLGQLGESAARHLQLSGHDVIVADSDMDRIEALKEEVSRAVCLDATDEHALRAAGFDDCSAVLMALGENNLEAAVVIAMALVELNIPYVISRATNDLQGKILTKIGVHRVIYPEKRVGAEVAKQLLSPSLNDIVALKNGLVLAELELPGILRNYTLIDLKWPVRFGITVAGQMTVSEHEEWGSAPRATAPLLECARLAVVGSNEEVSAFAAYFAAIEAGLREPLDATE
ncbi:MAG: TrkA family potassium uptake protein [Myxococcota bacterium]|nr:TrkA family potassium uptake protein [Myxococcota bacterium]